MPAALVIELFCEVKHSCSKNAEDEYHYLEQVGLVFGGLWRAKAAQAEFLILFYSSPSHLRAGRHRVVAREARAVVEAVVATRVV